MKRNPRAIVYGTGKGDVKLLDMNTFKVVKEFPQAHGSTISDLDTQGNTILTCGYSPRFLIPPGHPLSEERIVANRRGTDRERITLTLS